MRAVATGAPPSTSALAQTLEDAQGGGLVAPLLVETHQVVVGVDEVRVGRHRALVGGDGLELAVEILEHHTQVEGGGSLVGRGFERAPVVALGAVEVARLVEQTPQVEVGVGVSVVGRDRAPIGVACLVDRAGRRSLELVTELEPVGGGALDSVAAARVPAPLSDSARPVVIAAPAPGVRAARAARSATAARRAASETTEAPRGAGWLEAPKSRSICPESGAEGRERCALRLIGWTCAPRSTAPFRSLP